MTKCIFGHQWEGKIIAEHENVVILVCDQTGQTVVVHKETLDPNFKRVRSERGVYKKHRMEFDLKGTQKIFKNKGTLLRYLSCDQTGRY